MNNEQVKFLLNWNRFSDHLSSCMNKLMTDSSYSDIIIATADKQMIYSHRFVLANSSKYFQRLLRRINTNRGIQLVVALPEIKYDIFKILMNYMYKGVTQVPHELLPSVIRAGQFLEINGLMNLSESESNGSKPPNATKFNSPPEPPQQKCATVHPSTRKPSVGKESNKLFGPIPPGLLNKIHSRENSSVVSSKNSFQIDNKTKKSAGNDIHTGDAVRMVENGKENHSKLTKSSKSKSGTEEKKDIIQLPLKRKTYSKEPLKKISPVLIAKSSSSSPSSSSSSSSLVIESSPPKKRREIIIETDDPYEEVVITTEKKDDENISAEKENQEIQEIQEIHEIHEKNPKKMEPQEPHKSQEPQRPQECQKSSGKTVNIYSELKCEFCHKGFTKPTDWVKHMANKHADKGYKNFRDMQKSAETSPITCPACSCVCYSSEEWSRHLSRSGCCQPHRNKKGNSKIIKKSGVGEKK